MEPVPCYATVVMDTTAPATVYLIHAGIRGIHPMLWQRFLVRSDSTLADLHWILQIGLQTLYG